MSHRIEKFFYLGGLSLALFLAPPLLFGAAGAPTSQPLPSVERSGQVTSLGSQFFFEENRGQYSDPVRFFHRSKDYTVFLTGDELVTVFRQSLDPLEKGRKTGYLRLKFLQSNPLSKIVGQGKLSSESHYFLGNDPKDWLTHISHYDRLKIAELYPGIDIVFYGNSGRIEYDFQLQPNANPDLIQLQLDGASDLQLDEQGRLVSQLADGQVIQAVPHVFQMIGEESRPVAASYRLLGHNKVGFALGDYDSEATLVIDPLVLVYSTYLGGSARDDGQAITVDDEGNAYVAGFTSSDDFPADGTKNLLSDVFVSKFNADGSGLLFSTFIGGTSGDQASDIALGPDGSIYVTGSPSPDFPLTDGSFDTQRDGSTDAFVLRLGPDGSELLYSTLLGGGRDDASWGLAVDSLGSAYVAGQTNSDDFPDTGLQTESGPALRAPGPGNVDAFVTKLTPDGSGIVYSTYLGGSGTGAVGADRGRDVAVDAEFSAYVVGRTGSADFPLTEGVFQTELDLADAFVSKLSPDGSRLVYSTLLGGNSIDEPNSIALDSSGNAYITGHVGNSANVTFPTRNPIQAETNGLTESFVTKLNPTGTDLVYSTLLGGRATDRATSIAVDGEGSALVAGYTNSDERFPIVDSLPGIVRQETMIFVSKLTPQGDAYVYSTLLGGSGVDMAGDIPGGNILAVDREGSAYITGNTDSMDFPTASFQDQYGGGDQDAIVAKISEIFTSFFAQVGNGGGLVAEAVINNTSFSHYLSGSIQFTDDDADPLIFDLETSGGENVMVVENTVHYTLPPLGSITITSDGLGTPTPGAAKTLGNGRFGGVIRFTLPGIGTTGVAASQALSGFVSPVRRNAEGINTGVAIVNVGETPANLEFLLLDQQGQMLATANIDNFAAGAHLARFIDQLFPGVDSDFRGSVIVRATGSLIAATTLELGDDPGEFTTLPVTPLN